MAQRRKEIYDKLKSKYRLVIMRDATFEEVWFMRLSRLNVIALISSAVILISSLVVLLIVYTPLKEMIPGYPNAEMTKNIRLNAQRLDSLVMQLDVKDEFIDNLSVIMRGGEPIDLETAQAETPVSSENIQDDISKEDSILRLEVEEQQRYNLSLYDASSDSKKLSDLYFFPPVKGMITGHYDFDLKHFGVDVAVSGDLVVKAVLDGTVLMADYTVDTGYVIVIQHENELISVYKHNESLFKRPGDIILAGQSIAIVGNSGRITTGPHLHFEIWQNGISMNPEDYISFEQ